MRALGRFDPDDAGLVARQRHQRQRAGREMKFGRYVAVAVGVIDDAGDGLLVIFDLPAFNASDIAHKGIATVCTHQKTRGNFRFVIQFGNDVVIFNLIIFECARRIQ